MTNFKYCVIWEEQGSETVVYGPYDTWDEADICITLIKADLDIGVDEDPEDYGHAFQVANFVEEKK